jgi:hypothetical protein
MTLTLRRTVFLDGENRLGHGYEVRHGGQTDRPHLPHGTGRELWACVPPSKWGANSKPTRSHAIDGCEQNMNRTPCIAWTQTAAGCISP